MGTGLDLTMDRKIPTTLWKTQLLKLVSEAPKAVCVEVDWGHSHGSGAQSDDVDVLTIPRSIASESSSSTSTTSSDNNSPSLQLAVNRRRTNGHDKLGSIGLIGPNGPAGLESDPWDPLLDLAENPFGKAFHGYLSLAQTQDLILKDGQYLVRKRDNDEDFVLSFRFHGHLKNFIVSCDDFTGYFHLGDRGKSYETLQELVQEGLITLYLDQKAGSYIDLMCDLSQFHLNGQGVNSSTTNSMTRPRSTGHYTTSTNGHGGYYRKLSSSPSPTASTASRSSIDRQRSRDLRSHSFHIHTFEGLSRCQICQNFMWGLSSQGLRCEDCGFSVHEGCVEKVFSDCEPRLDSVKEVFGGSLRLLVKAAGPNRPPFVLEKCITEIEKRGLQTEGIYRVSGSRELIEKLRTYLETERDKADLSRHPDIHSMCGLVKLYLRLLPQPLISSDIFHTPNGSVTVEILKRYIRKLAPSHRLTLKYLLEHLHRVTQASAKNKMNAFNLSSVFTPSVICPTEISLSTLKAGTTVLEALITNVPNLYPPTALS